jgi:hypothetical protein
MSSADIFGSAVLSRYFPSRFSSAFALAEPRREPEILTPGHEHGAHRRAERLREGDERLVTQVSQAEDRPAC